jgi:hypothetical protein
MIFQVPGGPAGHRFFWHIGTWVSLGNAWSKRAAIFKSRFQQSGTGHGQSRTGRTIETPASRSKIPASGSVAQNDRQAGVPILSPRDIKKTRWSHAGCSRVPARILRHQVRSRRPRIASERDIAMRSTWHEVSNSILPAKFK